MLVNINHRSPLLQLPVSIVDQCQTPVVPRSFSQNGEQKQQPLHVEKQQKTIYTVRDQQLFSTGTGKTLQLFWQIKQTSCLSDWWTHQEAHKVQGKDSGHPTEGQALKHRAADPGRVTEVLGCGIGWERRAALWIGAPLNAPRRHDENQCSEHHCSMLITCQDMWADWDK